MKCLPQANERGKLAKMKQFHSANLIITQLFDFANLGVFRHFHRGREKRIASSATSSSPWLKDIGGEDGRNYRWYVP